MPRRAYFLAGNIPSVTIVVPLLVNEFLWLGSKNSTVGYPAKGTTLVTTRGICMWSPVERLPMRDRGLDAVHVAGDGGGRLGIGRSGARRGFFACGSFGDVSLMQSAGEGDVRSSQ